MTLLQAIKTCREKRHIELNVERQNNVYYYDYLKDSNLQAYLKARDYIYFTYPFLYKLISRFL